MVLSRRGMSAVKGKRIPGACDICKRKKIKCDSGERMGKSCTNCEAAGLDCTHRETTKALGSAKSYVTNLEMRLEKMEKVLSKLLPGVDLNTDLDHLVDMPESHNSPSFASSSESPEPVGTLFRHEEDDYVDKEVIIKLQKLDLVQEPRFFGGSSGFRLIQTALDFKSQYIGQSAGEAANIFNPRRREEFWVTFPWQRGKLDEELNLNASTFSFPDDDLFVSLIDLYFKEVNIFFPLLHRPTFERQIAEGLHNRDAMFGNVVLLVCALGSKHSDDPRVLTEGSNTSRSSGHKWFAQVDTCRKSYNKKPSLYELQMISLLMLFGKSAARPQGIWVHIGLGLKLAQEIGVHRRRPRSDKPPTVEDELWKRAFWVLLVHDRYVSASYGRPCTVYEEE
ncbi:hypothetical protein AX14_007261 [Amanita brunnescens Koide BX004]|nr:hypothetical protein AX14_007261 [Amanita brunnescens Koide BX004]